MMRVWAWLLLLCWPGWAAADETVLVCHGYDCAFQVPIRFTEGQLGQIRRQMAAAAGPDQERMALSTVIGRLLGWAGEQSDIHNDRGGNFADDGVSGRMDCIDHSTTTTRLLKLLAQRGYLRWHRVLEPESRKLAGVFPVHWSAIVEQTILDEPFRFAVDSWFVDNGQAAVILPIEDWKKGAGPDV